VVAEREPGAEEMAAFLAFLLLWPLARRAPLPWWKGAWEAEACWCVVFEGEGML
jgi:hypothetical protein